jgi:hypothetical protein
MNIQCQSTMEHAVVKAASEETVSTFFWHGIAGRASPEFHSSRRVKEEWAAGRQAPPDTTPPTDAFADRSAPPVPLCASPEMSAPFRS